MTYDTSNGFRSCLSVLNSPFKPSDRGPIYSSSKHHRQKWVEFCGSMSRQEIGRLSTIVNLGAT